MAALLAGFAALLWVASCVSDERREGAVRSAPSRGCGDALAPRLPLSSLRPDEISDECMMLWVRKGGAFSLGTYAPPDDDLVDVGNGHLLRSEPAAAFRRLQGEAAAAGYTIVAVSGYRSRERQARTHEAWVKRRLARVGGALDREEAEREVDEFSARAGHSEHQLGTTIDVTTPGVSPFNHDHGPSEFSTSCAGKWVRDNAHRFGFTMSYPHGREPITCFNPEPWHYRYVGVTLATELFAAGQSLEEYFRRHHADVEVPATIHCPHTRASLIYDVPRVRDCGVTEDRRRP